MNEALGNFIAGVSLTAIAALALMPQPVKCFEDEVIVWTGERHDRCLAIDTIVANGGVK